MRKLIAASLIFVSGFAAAQTRVRDVIYLKQGGCAYTMDVFKPKTPNHKAIVWMVSGGWVSNHESINPLLASALTDKGFTVFEVVHGSQPKFTIPEIVPQVRRAIRFIRDSAASYDISPNAIGVAGASAGGHLSLEIAGLGDDGDPNAKDPVERVSSRANAIVAFFPPTDFLNWGDTGNAAFSVPNMEVFYPAFGVTKSTPKNALEKIAKDVSPILLVKEGFPPTLLVHGDADKLVPIQQSKILDATFTAAHVEHKLFIVPGTGHDASTLLKGLAPALEWFDSHLSATSK